MSEVSNTVKDKEGFMKECIKLYYQKIRRMEYARLHSLVPSIASKPKVSKIQVVEEAIKYIAHLQETLASRNTTASAEEVRQRFVEQAGRRPSTLRQKRHKVASYMNRKPKVRNHSHIQKSKST